MGEIEASLSLQELREGSGAQFSANVSYGLTLDGVLKATRAASSPTYKTPCQKGGEKGGPACTKVRLARPAEPACRLMTD